MTFDLIGALGLGPRELVSLVGGGGKTTLLLEIGHRLADRGDRVILTTTTRLGRNEVGGVAAVWSLDLIDIELALDRPGPVFVLTDDAGDKVSGYERELVDELFVDTSAGFVLVEADGARGRPLKIPGDHEPVIPLASTLVILVAGVDAVGRTIFEAAHRPGAATALTGLGSEQLVTPPVVAAILTHPDGGLRGIPSAARVIVALTKVDAARSGAADEVAGLVAAHPRVERVVTVPPLR